MVPAERLGVISNLAHVYFDDAKNDDLALTHSVINRITRRRESKHWYTWVLVTAEGLSRTISLPVEDNQSFVIFLRIPAWMLQVLEMLKDVLALFSILDYKCLAKIPNQVCPS